MRKTRLSQGFHHILAHFQHRLQERTPLNAALEHSSSSYARQACKSRCTGMTTRKDLRTSNSHSESACNGLSAWQGHVEKHLIGSLMSRGRIGTVWFAGKWSRGETSAGAGGASAAAAAAATSSPTHPPTHHHHHHQHTHTHPHTPAEVQILLLLSPLLTHACQQLCISCCHVTLPHCLLEPLASRHFVKQQGPAHNR